jgi:hypothetical protein
MAKGLFGSEERIHHLVADDKSHESDSVHIGSFQWEPDDDETMSTSAWEGLSDDDDLLEAAESKSNDSTFGQS